ncbi:MAG TPA: hypothetical protein VF533_11270 [Solirubrobacteraceae bacterium]|jgi:hypothetical protein
MVVVYAATIWLLWSAFLLFPHFGLPRYMARAAMTLLCGELLALLVAFYAVPGSVAHEAARLVAGEVPALGVGLLAVAIWLGLRAARARAGARPAVEALTRRSRSEP